ncbi:hypothetical protein TSUD_37340 [Trifolium subterraneum]|uniref:Reverse transcriptase zinc-binding domain-containing protein n=1 Tax=Trifolium subterraneum TaxID=3900 RepID=A0A2Z6ML76_TRISU|nr:hypothetical protein TSUD_37340 [Trifolium subterraneum]
MLTSGVDRVPIRQNLLRRRVIRGPSGALCAFCGASVEAIDHLFITCGSISLVWYSIFRWLGFQFVSPMSIRGVFQGFLALSLGRKNRGIVSVESSVDKVKLSSWKWYIWLKTLVISAPSVSGRCIQSCAGAVSGLWVAGSVFWFRLL